ncbi:MAG TPA: ActR/PrrA/RegA family redox response regulator transcription factor [Hellea balneolensis]|uniref:ActR/PrrA/RegA family redox response regulator transcription factor n=1 Tax=Hellea balneolensis TaxID=287478 RepID=A0A7V5NXT8_9PROT|nr:ActR/PrrA/RegA family redox response regulator transcription factor [Hellea balneolensis]
MVVEDNQAFRIRLGRALEARGFDVVLAGSIAEATAIVKSNPPAFAVIDMRLDDGSGLDIVALLHERRPSCKMIMLTGYANLATAVAAVKAGAVDYLAKPADADDVTRALLAQGDKPEPPENPMSADRVRWEHIQRVYELCDHNVSETARRLNMHRRTLQRILAKHAPR